MPTLESILVPVDGSPPSLAALEHAVALAEDYSARVNVLTVVPPTDPLSRDARAEIERALDAALVRAHNVLGNRVSRETAVGDPLVEIIERAQEGPDLIVMGTHGRVGRLHSLLGSTAEGVVRNAPCPVLTVRDTSEGYQSFAERRHHRTGLGDQHPHH
jgi:nucleotide-binding universal stress UspA family protein